MLGLSSRPQTPARLLCVPPVHAGPKASPTCLGFCYPNDPLPSIKMWICFLLLCGEIPPNLMAESKNEYLLLHSFWGAGIPGRLSRAAVAQGLLGSPGAAGMVAGPGVIRWRNFPGGSLCGGQVAAGKGLRPPHAGLLSVLVTRQWAPPRVSAFREQAPTRCHLSHPCGSQTSSDCLWGEATRGVTSGGENHPWPS